MALKHKSKLHSPTDDSFYFQTKMLKAMKKNNNFINLNSEFLNYLEKYKITSIVSQSYPNIAKEPLKWLTKKAANAIVTNIINNNFFECKKLSTPLYQDCFVSRYILSNFSSINNLKYNYNNVIPWNYVSE